MGTEPIDTEQEISASFEHLECAARGSADPGVCFQEHRMEIQSKKSTVSRSSRPSGANMSLSPVEALGQVDLEAGRVYRRKVNCVAGALRDSIMGISAVPPATWN